MVATAGLSAWIGLAGTGEAGTVTYQQGDGKGTVSRTDDATLDETTPGVNYGGSTNCSADASPHQHCVLQFPNLFGDGVDQIPLGSGIQSATLTLYVSDAGAAGACPTVYRLTEGWVETQATWSARGTGVSWSDPGADGPTSRVAAADGVLPCTTAGAFESVDVTSSVRSWSQGATNAGWVLVNGASSNGVFVVSSDGANLSRRPQLTVQFTPTRYRSIGTAPPYGVGQVAVTNGSNVVAGTGTAWLANNRGRGDVITIPCGDPPTCTGGVHYTVLGVDPGNVLRLTQPYAGTTAASQSYLIRRQFSTLGAWEDCIDGNPCGFFPVASSSLVADDRSEVGIAYKDSVFALSADVQIDGSTTDALHTITLTADGVNRHHGMPGAGVVVNGQDGPNGIVVRDDHVTLEWLELIRVKGANDKAAILVEGAGQTNLLFQKLLVHDFLDAARAVAGIGLSSSGLGNRVVTIRNALIWDGDEEGIHGGQSTDAVTIENCSIDGMAEATAVGIDAVGSAVTVVNTIVTRSGSGLDFDPDLGSFTPGSSNNMSSDGSAPGASAQLNVLAGDVFVSPGMNLHLKPAPNPALDMGLDLSAASGFQDDVDGHPRPSGPGWDVGADESITGSADLGITKDDGQISAAAGSFVSYAITVTNNGPDAVASVTVSDPVPAAILGAVFDTTNGTFASGSGLWTFASPLLAGQSAILTLSGTIDPTATGTLSNTATVTPPAPLTDPVSGNDSATDMDTLFPEADLAITKVENADPVDIGNVLLYTITVTNQGPTTATGVVMEDTLVTALEFQSATPTQGGCAYDGPSRKVTCNLGTLAPATSATIALLVRPLTLGTFTNTATVVGIEPDPVSGNDSATETTTVGTAQSCLVTTDFAGGDDRALGVGIQPDGRIVVGGSTYSSGGDFAAARYTPDLQLDGSFGLAGRITTDIDGDDEAAAGLVVRSDGRVVLGGSARSGPPMDFALLRYDAGGALDPTFNPGGAYGFPPNLSGIVTTPVGTDPDQGRALALQSDGKVLLGGLTQTGGTDAFGLVRYKSDGDLDPSFGSGGIVVTPIGTTASGQALAVQPDGRIVMAGAAYNPNAQFALARYDPDGTLDGSFGAGGVVLTDLRGAQDWALDVVVQPDGKIVAVGYSQGGANFDFAIVRYNPDGSLDTASFNPAGTLGEAPNVPGMVFTRFAIGFAYAYGVALQPDGRIVVVGSASNGVNEDFAMARYNPDGSLDASFGVGGRVMTAIGSSSDTAQGVMLQPDGRILVSGFSYDAATDNDFALARYTPTGQLEGGCGTTRYRSIGTAPDYGAGQVDVTNGSNLVSGVGTTWLASNRGRGDVITIPCPDPPTCTGGTDYSVLGVDSEIIASLTQPYAGPTTSGLSYLIRRPFATLQDWGACVDGSGPCPFFPVGSPNLVTDNRSEVGVAYADSVFAMTSTFRLTGATTDALHTITLTADGPNRHNGVAGAGVVIDAQDGPFGIDVEDDYVTLEWLEIKRFRGVDNEGAITLSGGKGPRGALLQNLLIHDFLDPTVEIDGIRLSGVGVKEVTVRNTMIWDGDQYGIRGDEPFDVLTIENTSIDGIVDGGGRGIYAENSTVTITNTIVTGSASADYAPGTGTLLGSNNISEDATAPGTGALFGVMASDVFIGPGDLRLKAAPNPAIDSGLDLSSSSGFQGDIEGQLRPSGAAWDRGADESASSALDLGITKDDGQATAVPGTGILYAMTVTNYGPDSVTSATVIDPVPPAILGPFFNTTNGTFDGGTGLWTFASPLLAGQSAVLSLVGTIDPGATGTLTNTATVSPPAGYSDPVTANDSATDIDVLAPSADLAIAKIDDVDPVDIGNLVTYTLTVTNVGPSSATGVTVTDTLVAEMDYDSASPSQGSCNFDGPTRTLTCDLGTIAPGGSATVTLVVRAMALGTFVNAADVTAAEADPVTGNDSATETTTVQIASEGVRFFTVTSTSETNVLEWLNPTADYVSTEIVYRTDTFPTDVADPMATSIYTGGTAGAKDSFVHSTGAGTNGQTYYYGAFVHRSAAPAVSAGRFCTGRPFDNSGAVKWAFSTGAFSLTPPTVGGAGVVAPANDRGLYAMERGPLGGQWPAGWHPAQLGGVVQARSPVVPISVAAANPVVYLGAQDGSVYVVDGTLGGAAAFPWPPSAVAGMVQAAPAGIFSAFGAGPLNYLLVGTRDGGADNALVALDPATGGFVYAFDNGGSPTGIGVISGMAAVDYSTQRVYFASHENAAGSNGTLWCLQIAASAPELSLVWQRPLGDIDGSPVIRGGRVYVGSTLGGGTVFSIDAATGNPILDRTFVHGDGPVKSFVWPDRFSPDIYFATDNSVWAVSDTGAASMPNKFAGPISLGVGVTPSAVLLVPGSHYLYAGGSDGSLYEIDVLGAAPSLKSVPLGDALATVGAPSLDAFYGLVHVGTEAGIFYAVGSPLP